MGYDFTSVPDRSGCGSTKWDGVGAGVDCVPLSVADMEFPTAPAITEAIKKTADTTILGYTQATEGYYDAVIHWMKRRHRFDIKKEWILNTPGVVNALGLLIEAATKPGDGVIVLTPVYYPFDMSVLAKGRSIIYSELIDNNGHYEIDYADLERKARLHRAKAMLFCNPHNPVGRVWTRAELQKVAEICLKHDIFIIDDEIHNDIIMPGIEHTCMGTLSLEALNNIAVCTAPSKTFNLAGLQCSNIIVPSEKIRTRAMAHNYLNMLSTLNIFAYTACKAAYETSEDWLEEMIGVVDGNAKYVASFMAENFPEIRVYPLEGTYLLWVDMRALGLTHKELRALLEDAGIYLDNGEIFGQGGRGFQRFNLACARVTLEKTMARFKAAVEKLQADRRENGVPYHCTLNVGAKVENFTYASLGGESRTLRFEKPTLLVFSRFYDCPLCRAALAMVTAAYPTLKLKGYDVKFITQDDAKTLSSVAPKLPFEMIADRDKTLYDRYNVFDAESTVQMLAGDRLFERFIGKNVRKMLSTPLADVVAGAMNSSPAADGPRSRQLQAFVAVDKNATVTYSRYCKTVAEFPGIRDLLFGI